MKRIAVLAALLLASSAAFANSCPLHMKDIHAARKKVKLNAQQAAQVEVLRAEGEKLHKAGRHAESMTALGKAKGILGIK